MAPPPYLARLARPGEGARAAGRLAARVGAAAGRADDLAHVVAVLARAGVLAPVRPDRALAMAQVLRRWGPVPAAGYRLAAIRRPGGLALVDEMGPLSFAEADEASTRLANALAERGIGAGDRVALLCRNHRYFVHTVVACSKLGAHVLLLNTMFAGPQVAEVTEREKVVAVVFDAGLARAAAAAAGQSLHRFVAWSGEGTGSRAAGGADPTIEELVERGSPRPLAPPALPARIVILTSGTTGRPKGADRPHPHSVAPAAALLSRIPLRSGEPTMVAAPLFHTWGLAHFVLGLPLCSTMILHRRFEAEATLAAIQEHRCTALVVVPVMLQRLLELPAATLDAYDTSSLRVIAASGSALPGGLAGRVMDRFGPVLYNLYGSTEVAWATIAGPEDLRASPGTAGRPPRGTTVKLLDDRGQEVPEGQPGRIFVGNEMLFEGYTGGGTKEVIAGLMATGDVGRMDGEGRLVVIGRDDEMIVSGGENVFPSEVEDLLAEHPAVEEVAVVGTHDEQFGQRLVAFVVLRAGASLPAEQVMAHVRDNLAAYKAPREVRFLDCLPRNATGKVLKRELAALLAG